MIKKRNYLDEILEKKGRLLKKTTISNQYNRRIHLVVETFRFLEFIKTKHPVRNELLKYIPIAYVSCLEGYFRLLLKTLIDHGSPFSDNASALDEIRFNTETVIAITSQRITLGEYISHFVTLNNLEEINRIFSIILGIDFLEELKKIDYLILEDGGPFQLAMPLLQDEEIKSIKELFRLRHIFCHELAPRERIGVRKIQKCVSAGASLSLIIQTLINKILPQMKKDSNH